MLDKIHALVLAHQVISGSALVIVEFILRMIPSQKPIGIIHAISGIAHKLGDIFGGIASFLDSILPQNVSGQ